MDDPTRSSAAPISSVLRDVNFDGTAALDDVARCYKYWIALTDCDGFRLDTLKHVPESAARNFCGAIKEFAGNLGKTDFFLVGEVAGSDDDADATCSVLGSNLDATLDIGEMPAALHGVAKGLVAPAAYFDFAPRWDDDLGSHRDSGNRHVSILDDHDHVSGDKVRFSTDAASDHQVVAGVAIQLFSLGIPCIYYGTEQALAGPERASERPVPAGLTPARTGPVPARGDVRAAHTRAAGRAGLAPATGDETPACRASAHSAPPATTASTRAPQPTCASPR